MQTTKAFGYLNSATSFVLLNFGFIVWWELTNSLYPFTGMGLDWIVAALGITVWKSYVFFFKREGGNYWNGTLSFFLLVAFLWFVGQTTNLYVINPTAPGATRLMAEFTGIVAAFKLITMLGIGIHRSWRSGYGGSDENTPA